MESLRCLAHGTVEKVTIVFDLTGETSSQCGSIPGRLLTSAPVGFGLANMDWRVSVYVCSHGIYESHYWRCAECRLLYNGILTVSVVSRSGIVFQRAVAYSSHLRYL